MQIQIIAVGRIKEPYLADGIAEYEKRLRPYAKVRITEVAEEKRPAHPSPAQQAQALEKEGARIVGLVPDGIYLIALDVRGEQVSSEGLAALLQDREISGNSSLVFVLGGDLGLSENVLNRSHLRLSLSPMTFTHPMVRLILLEQVYRAFRIMRGEPYHK
jgi:23S rRNA (pseudouridine1915-N3)-methyltransferase